MNQQAKGAAALLLASALSAGVVWAAWALTGTPNPPGESGDPGRQSEPLDVSGHEGIREARLLLDADGSPAGYAVTAAVMGYKSEIAAEITFDGAGAIVTGVRVLEQNETENLGARVAEVAFLEQFSGISVPVSLRGAAAAQEYGPLRDGKYEAEGAERDGFTPRLMMTVEGGRITAAFWDEISAEGQSKREMSERGEYVMTADGPTWAEQAEAMEQALIERQSPAAIPADSAGRTDAVSGVSISVSGFLALAGECLRQASGAAAPAPQGAEIDAVSGATASSAAVVKGVNLAYEFVQSAAR